MARVYTYTRAGTRKLQLVLVNVGTAVFLGNS